VRTVVVEDLPKAEREGARLRAPKPLAVGAERLPERLRIERGERRQPQRAGVAYAVVRRELGVGVSRIEWSRMMAPQRARWASSRNRLAVTARLRSRISVV